MPVLSEAHVMTYSPSSTQVSRSKGYMRRHRVVCDRHHFFAYLTSIRGRKGLTGTPPGRCHQPTRRLRGLMVDVRQKRKGSECRLFPVWSPGAGLAVG